MEARLESDEERPAFAEVSLTMIFDVDVYLLGSGDFSGAILMDMTQNATRRTPAIAIGMTKYQSFFQQNFIRSTRSISNSSLGMHTSC